jgi:hypothetical protein
MADWFDAGGDHSVEVSAARLLDTGAFNLVTCILDLGALVSFGKSRDGGALGVTVTHNGRWRREWFRDLADLGAWLSAAAAAVESASHAAYRPPPASQEPRRRPQNARRGAGGGGA